MAKLYRWALRAPCDVTHTDVELWGPTQKLVCAPSPCTWSSWALLCWLLWGVSLSPLILALVVQRMWKKIKWKARTMGKKMGRKALSFRSILWGGLWHLNAGDGIRGWSAGWSGVGLTVLMAFSIFLTVTVSIKTPAWTRTTSSTQLLPGEMLPW